MPGLTGRTKRRQLMSKKKAYEMSLMFGAGDGMKAVKKKVSETFRILEKGGYEIRSVVIAMVETGTRPVIKKRVSRPKAAPAPEAVPAE